MTLDGVWFEATIRAHGSQTMVDVLSSSPLGFTPVERRATAFSVPDEYLMAVDAVGAASLQDAIEQLADRAVEARALLHRQNIGARIDLFLGVASEGHQISLSLEPELLTRLATNKVSLLMSIYPDA